MSEELTELAGTTFGKSLSSVFAKVGRPAGAVGFAGGFIADVLQPLAPVAQFVLGISVGAVVVLLLWALISKGSRMWTLPTAVLAVFMALFSGGLFALQKTTGGEKSQMQGVIASQVPAVAGMQADWMNEMKGKIASFETKMEDLGHQMAQANEKLDKMEKILTEPEAIADSMRRQIKAKADTEIAAAKNREERRELERRRDAALARVDDVILTIQEGLQGQSDPIFEEASSILAEEGAEKALAYLNGETSRIQVAADSSAAQVDSALETLQAKLKSLLLKAQLQEANLDLAGQLATLEEVAKKAPSWSQARLRLGETYTMLARYDEAEPHLLAALDHAGNDKDRALALDRIGTYYVDRGRPEKAEPLLVEALKLREAAAKEKATAGNDPLRDKAESLNNLGRVLRVQGHYEKAGQLYQEALKIRREGARGNDPAWQEDLAESLNNLAALHFAQQQYDQAEPLYQESLQIRKETLGWKEHPKTAESLNNLAELHRKKGEFEKAEPLYLEALDIDKKVFGEKHADVAIDMNNLANLYLIEGKLDAAQPLYSEALKIREEVLKPKDPDDPEHPLVAQSCYNLAQLYIGQGKNAEAKALLERAAKIREENVFSNLEVVRDLANALNNLAALEYAAGNYPEAEKLLTRAMPLNEQALPENSPQLAKWYGVLADVYVAQKRDQEAERYMAKAFAIQEKSLGSSEPKLAEATFKMAELYRKIGKNAEAKTYYERLLGIVLKQAGAQHQDFILMRGMYTEFLKAQMGMTEEASNAEVERVIAAAQKNP